MIFGRIGHEPFIKRTRVKPGCFNELQHSDHRLVTDPCQFIIFCLQVSNYSETSMTADASVPAISRALYHIHSPPSVINVISCGISPFAALTQSFT
ncbi:hypothetical protein PM082_017696 [Marasmius tenuissimus]|nr:hypothetical protein PM082_017696 [Marasmius tenuissimus]